jgi:hypothetical protein
MARQTMLRLPSGALHRARHRRVLHSKLAAGRHSAFFHPLPGHGGSGESASIDIPTYKGQVSSRNERQRRQLALCEPFRDDDSGRGFEQCEVGECLREITQMSPGLDVEFLRIKSER